MQNKSPEWWLAIPEAVTCVNASLYVASLRSAREFCFPNKFHRGQPVTRAVGMPSRETCLFVKLAPWFSLGEIPGIAQLRGFITGIVHCLWMLRSTRLANLSALDICQRRKCQPTKWVDGRTCTWRGQRAFDQVPLTRARLNSPPSRVPGRACRGCRLRAPAKRACFSLFPSSPFRAAFAAALRSASARATVPQRCQRVVSEVGTSHPVLNS